LRQIEKRRQVLIQLWYDLNNGYLDKIPDGILNQWQCQYLSVTIGSVDSYFIIISANVISSMKSSYT